MISVQCNSQDHESREVKWLFNQNIGERHSQPLLLYIILIIAQVLAFSKKLAAFSFCHCA